MEGKGFPHFGVREQLLSMEWFGHAAELGKVTSSSLVAKIKFVSDPLVFTLS